MKRILDQVSTPHESYKIRPNSICVSIIAKLGTSRDNGFYFYSLNNQILHPDQSSDVAKTNLA